MNEEEKIQNNIETMGKQKKKNKTDRGIETLFRITSRNHLNLSAIADRKANILISINAVIISIILSVVIRRVSVDQDLIIPTIILLIVCVVTIVFATIATRPKVSSGNITPEDVEQKKGNLLFFGNFYKMSLEEYEKAMTVVMNDREYIYLSMIRDIYAVGTVLIRKYKYLKIAYNIFMYGLIIAVISFLLEMVHFF
ncbi:MAG: hypothetical protein IIB83_00735 [Bacteroidetes bacterium]|nr:hypothetical protein [Bacteroidota bacterium]